MKTLFAFTLAFISIVSFAQDNWDNWNDTYTEVDPIKIIQLEKQYADSIQSNDVADDYYLRMDTYRFSAQYLSGKRAINESTKKSMARAYKMLGNPDYISLINKLKFEYQFKIGSDTLWFSIQNVLNKSFKKEIKKSDQVYLYCLFLNEFSYDGVLYNSFLISEFYKE